MDQMGQGFWFHCVVWAIFIILVHKSFMTVDVSITLLGVSAFCVIYQSIRVRSRNIEVTFSCHLFFLLVFKIMKQEYINIHNDIFLRYYTLILSVSSPTVSYQFTPVQDKKYNVHKVCNVKPILFTRQWM